MPILTTGKQFRIGVFLPRWLGDFVMATPALRAIRAHYGSQAWIVGIMPPYQKDVLTGTGWLDEQWYFDPRGKWPLGSHLRIWHKLFAAKFDVVFLMPNSPRSAILTWFGRAKRRIGYARYGRGPLLTDPIRLPNPRGRTADRPMVDYYLRLAEAAGCPPGSPRLELATTPRDERTADRVFQQLGLPADGRLITFNSSGAYGAAKLWPAGHFAALARRIVDELDHHVLVMCGPNEQATAGQITALAARPQVVSMRGQPLDIGTAKACIRRSRLMISTDSGPRHLAAALGKAVITLYGPMLPVWGRNPTVDAIDLYLKDLECIGCHQRVCPYKHHKCMQDLSVEMVYREVSAWIARTSVHRVA